MALIAFFGGSSYVETITEEYKDSINSVRSVDKHKFDSLNFVLDSLDGEAKRKDTILVNIYRYEKIYIDAVDTIHDDSLKSAIRNLFYY